MALFNLPPLLPYPTLPMYASLFSPLLLVLLHLRSICHIVSLYPTHLRTKLVHLHHCLPARWVYVPASQFNISFVSNPKNIGTHLAFSSFVLLKTLSMVNLIAWFKQSGFRLSMSLGSAPPSYVRRLTSGGRVRFFRFQSHIHRCCNPKK